MNTTIEGRRTAAWSVSAETIFRRILLGVDGSPESREAGRQAALLLEPGWELALLAAVSVPPAVASGAVWGVPAYVDDDVQRAAAKDSLEQARAKLRGVSPRTKLVRDGAWHALIREAERTRATLIAVGSHGIGRAEGIVMGSTTTEVIHKAPCSVLVARGAEPDFPRKIVVGVDGSPHSIAAYEVARHLRARYDAELWPVFARGGKGVDERLVASIVGHHYEALPDKPVKALVAAAADADLVIVGSRGLHGLDSLGSVSERVAHQARSSVLIVREGDRD
jgi:nucleotide-binding universal stress UspA family protein